MAIHRSPHTHLHSLGAHSRSSSFQSRWGGKRWPKRTMPHHEQTTTFYRQAWTDLRRADRRVPCQPVLRRSDVAVHQGRFVFGGRNRETLRRRRSRGEGAAERSGQDSSRCRPGKGYGHRFFFFCVCVHVCMRAQATDDGSRQNGHQERERDEGQHGKYVGSSTDMSGPRLDYTEVYHLLNVRISFMNHFFTLLLSIHNGARSPGSRFSLAKRRPSKGHTSWFFVPLQTTDGVIARVQPLYSSMYRQRPLPQLRGSEHRARTSAYEQP